MAQSESDIASNYRDACAAFAKAGGGDMKSLPGIMCIRSPMNYIDFNMAFVEKPTGIRRKTLRQVLEFYRGVNAEWCFSVNPELTSLLAKVMKYLRISTWDRSPEMVVERKDASFRKAPSSLKVEAVTSVNELRDWVRVAALGFETADPNSLQRIANPAALEIPGLTFLIGLREGRAVATSASYVSKGVAGVYAVRTISEARGKGYGEALSAAAAEDGFSRGCTVSSLQASPMGFPLYHRMGYRHVFDYQRWVVSRSAPEIKRT